MMTRLSSSGSASNFRPAAGLRQPPLQHRLVHQEQNRRNRHGYGNHRDQQIRQFPLDDPPADGDGENDEGELAALRDRHAEGAGRGIAQPEQTAEPEQDGELYAHQADDQQRDDRGFAEHQADIERHADGDKEQAEKQSLERLDVGFQGVAVFRLGEQHARQERAERHGKPEPRHHQRHADNTQQRHRRKGFANVRAGHDPQQKTQQEMTGGDDDHQNGDRADAGDGAGTVHRAAGLGTDQGHQRQQRYDREILKQQDGERRPAVLRRQLMLLGQHLQREGGRRQR